ncbi:hypothetical protein TorRG33x02_215050 [Trema orientale]|uniref:Uncharacterized protein n=1 Tax=Trema orientale TaxID=63057 RepID=A0A2P5EB27_TREOI|nr:hypothetical protein TorRG33x02_215050 [Trema orientale]
MMVFNFLFEERHGLVQSTRLCCPLGRFVSSALKPVSSSSSTTPNPYTSLFTYKWPVECQHKCQAYHLVYSAENNKSISYLLKISSPVAMYSGAA